MNDMVKMKCKDGIWEITVNGQLLPVKSVTIRQDGQEFGNADPTVILEVYADEIEIEGSADVFQCDAGDQNGMHDGHRS